MGCVDRPRRATRLRPGDAGGFGIGVGNTAFLLGARHAFDADHIAIIDSATRKLVGEGRPTLGTGFWFALGHSSVVFALSLLLALGVRALAASIQDQDSALQHSFGVVGSLAAGMFLIVVGLMNLSAPLGLVHAPAICEREPSTRTCSNTTCTSAASWPASSSAPRRR